MWKSDGKAIEMSVGDYGVDLPITISGAEFGGNDSLAFSIYRGANVIVKKVYEAANNITVSLTEDETNLLTSGAYRYAIDWYADNAFMCNIVSNWLHVVGK